MKALCHITTNLLPAQPGARSVHGWSYMYSYFRVCLLVRLSQSGEAWERVNGGQLARFELAGLFASSLQNQVKQCLYDRQSAVEAQLLLNKRERAPIARECKKMAWLTTNQTRSETARYFVSYKRAP